MREERWSDPMYSAWAVYAESLEELGVYDGVSVNIR
jgi:hypothetical protein